MRILVVEDDQLLNSTLHYNLITVGYEVDAALTKKDAQYLYRKQKYDLIILDINLPDGNGFDLCEEIQKHHDDTAIVFLTANDMEYDILKGYEIGADDYITKPFSMSVFKKKIAAILYRITQKNSEDFYEDDILYINFTTMKSTLCGSPVVFTPLEYRLLKILTRNPQTVLTRKILLEKLWDINGNFVDEHALTAAISRVRNKIEISNQQYIKTVYGMGYIWVGGIQK